MFKDFCFPSPTVFFMPTTGCIILPVFCFLRPVLPLHTFSCLQPSTVPKFPKALRINKQRFVHPPIEDASIRAKSGIINIVIKGWESFLLHPIANRLHPAPRYSNPPPYRTLKCGGLKPGGCNLRRAHYGVRVTLTFELL